MTTLPKVKYAQPDGLSMTSTIPIRRSIKPAILQRIIKRYGFNLQAHLLARRDPTNSGHVYPLWRLSNPNDRSIEKKIYHLLTGNGKGDLKGVTCYKAATNNGSAPSVENTQATMFCTSMKTYLKRFVPEERGLGEILKEMFTLKNIVLMLLYGSGAILVGFITFFILPKLTGLGHGGPPGAAGGVSQAQVDDLVDQAFVSGVTAAARVSGQDPETVLDRIMAKLADKKKKGAADNESEPAAGAEGGEPAPASSGNNMIAVASPLANVMKGARIASRFAPTLAGTQTLNVASGSSIMMTPRRTPISLRRLGIMAGYTAASGALWYLTRGKVKPSYARAFCPR